MEAAPLAPISSCIHIYMHIDIKIERERDAGRERRERARPSWHAHVVVPPFLRGRSARRAIFTYIYINIER